MNTVKEKPAPPAAPAAKRADGRSFYVWLAAIVTVSAVLLFTLGQGRAGYRQGIVIDADAAGGEAAAIDMAAYFSQDGRIDINTAPIELLETLPGVGPAIGRRIIDGRPYGSVEELTGVSGIGQKTLDKLRPLVCAQQIE